MSPLERKRAFLFRWALPYALALAVLVWQARGWKGAQEYVVGTLVAALFLVILFFVIRRQDFAEYDEDSMPTWRKNIRRTIAPYRRVVTLVAVALMALAWLNSAFDWGLLNLHGRKSDGVGLLIGFIWLWFAGPTVQEMRSQGTHRDNGGQ